MREMDFDSVFQQALNSPWLLALLVALFAVFVAVIGSAWFKGISGEFLVNVAIGRFLPKGDYHLIKDVTLSTERGTTQIDHIVVSRYGVFVIETKNLKGWIFGSVNQKTWTQKIYKNTYKFQNPLRQNYKHVKTLETLLDIPAPAIHSLVIFAGDCTFKTAMPDNVIYASSNISYIKSKREICLSQADVNAVVSQINQLRLKRGLTTNRQHVSHLRTKKDEPSIGGTPMCPKCGSSMVLRTAGKGNNIGNKFWGCVAFPACRGTIKQR